MHTTTFPLSTPSILLTNTHFAVNSHSLSAYLLAPQINAVVADATRLEEEARMSALRML
jgi:hypothetical protein